MKRNQITIIATIVMALLLAVSCSQKAVDGLGTVRLTNELSREVTASIDYPDVNSLTWKVSATKTSRGSKVGEGLYENVILTDFMESFSIGVWNFVLDGYDGTTKVYHGEKEAYIIEGENTIEISVSTVSEYGKWTIVNSHFTDYGLSARGERLAEIQVIVDGTVANTYSKNAVITRNDGLLQFQTDPIVKSATDGVHTFRIVFVGNNGSRITAEEFKARIVGGLVTEISFGKFEGKTGLSVTIDEQDAIVEEE